MAGGGGGISKKKHSSVFVGNLGGGEWIWAVWGCWLGARWRMRKGVAGAAGGGGRSPDGG
jgi:hypothetical protein